jgi:hypothetical protein
VFLENKFIKNLQLLKQKLCKNTISIMKGLYIRVSNTGFLGPGLGAESWFVVVSYVFAKMILQ